MAHIHPVYDDDPHFLIKPETRSIVSTSAERIVLIKGDHNSEIFTFEMPKEVDGHDMSQCNLVQIHYINSEADSRTARSVGVYKVTDLQASADDENTLVFSWLISTNATKFVGPLNFAIRFACINGSKIEYAWNTSIFGSVSIATSIDNSDIVVEQYDDTLQQWYEEIVMASIMSEAAMEAAKEEAKAEMIEEASDIVNEAVLAGTTEAVENAKTQLNEYTSGLKTELEETIPDEAVKATRDANGNVIHETYVAKNDTDYANSALEEKLTNGDVVPAKAETAIKATHDAEGNDIAATYLRKDSSVDSAKVIDASKTGKVQIKPESHSDMVEFTSYDPDDLPITKYKFTGNNSNSVVLDIENKTIGAHADSATYATIADVANKTSANHISKSEDLINLATNRPNNTFAITFTDKVLIQIEDENGETKSINIPIYSKGYMSVGSIFDNKIIISIATPELKSILLVGKTSTVDEETSVTWAYKDKPDEAVHSETSGRADEADHATNSDTSENSDWTKCLNTNVVKALTPTDTGILIDTNGLYAVVIAEYKDVDGDVILNKYYTALMYIDTRYESAVRFKTKFYRDASGIQFKLGAVVYSPEKDGYEWEQLYLEYDEEDNVSYEIKKAYLIMSAKPIDGV